MGRTWPRVKNVEVNLKASVSHQVALEALLKASVLVQEAEIVTAQRPPVVTRVEGIAERKNTPYHRVIKALRPNINIQRRLFRG